MKDLWSPSFDFAQYTIETLLERFEWALRDKALATKIMPYGYNSSLTACYQVVNLSQYKYDPRDDKYLEVDEEEPVSLGFDNCLPKSAIIKNPASD